MAHQSALIAEDIQAYLQAHEVKSLLRFLTCGSVDDGKSTLIGRLLYDSKMIFEDQLAALEADSKRVGTQGQEIDFALLVDGLAAEREQGITIDVAYRFFATSTRKFIVADTPGHEQYTRNMVTGASTADAAVILIDARKGVLTQTRRHSYLAHLIGIRNLVLAVNKMDLVGYDQAVFDAIVAEYRDFATGIGITDFVAMPISGFKGDNITEVSANTPWYRGQPLIAHLETVEIDQVHLRHRQHEMADTEQLGEIAVPPGLGQHALASVDQKHGEVRRRRAGHHVARVLLMPRRIGDDELALFAGEEAVGDVDGDALLALRLQPIDEQREVHVVAGRAEGGGIAPQVGDLVLHQ